MSSAFVASFPPVLTSLVSHTTTLSSKSHRHSTLHALPPRAVLPSYPSDPSVYEFTPIVISSPIQPFEDDSATSFDPSLSGGTGNPPTSGGRGGDGSSDGEPEDSADDSALEVILSRHNATLADIPHDILGAYQNGYVGVDNISNYLAAQASFLSRLLMGCGSGMRNRFLADKLFLLKILIEEGIGVFGKLSAEYEQRRSNFWKEGEFVFANLITAILADFALVYLPAPSVALTRGGGGSGFGAWLAEVSTNLPSNIFQTDRPFTLAQRCGGFALKGTQLFVVGMMCCLVGSALTNGLVYVREKLDKNYEPQTKKPNVLTVSTLYATFLGVSSGSRYQLVNGIESHLFPKIFGTSPKLFEKIATFAMRYGNTFWGSQQWVMFCRFTNVQKTKAD